MNQLQNLLHDALIGTNHVQACALVRWKDSTLQASSVGFKLFQDQIDVLIDAFNNPALVRENGLFFDDITYECIRADRNSIYAKHKKRGVILVRTSTLMLVATYSDSMYPSVCVEAVERLADYFKEKGK